MSVFPEIIRHVPQRDYGIEGLTVRVDHTSTGTVYFVSAEKEVHFPEHAHAEQWTIVVSGKCLLTMDGETSSQAIRNIKSHFALAMRKSITSTIRVTAKHNLFLRGLRL